MNIAAINGSPKAKDSISGLIIGQLERLCGKPVAAHQAAQLVQDETPGETLAQLINADALLIVFPLYVDGLPAPLVELLTRMEHAAQEATNRPRVYVAVNCGFYEAEHTRLALDMMRHFADRAEFPWGMGLGIGRGPMLSAMGGDWSKGPAASVYGALERIARAVRGGTPEADAFAGAKFPRVLYTTMAHIGWRSMARKAGARGKLRARPYAR